MGGNAAHHDQVLQSLPNPLNKPYPPLISLEDFQERWADSAGVVVLDVRREDDYNEGHIPNAQQLWRTDIESDDQPYGGMAIGATGLENLLRTKGVNSNSHLILYDGVGGCDAARLWWLLECYGFSNVSLLDGGWQAWQHHRLHAESGGGQPVAAGDFRFADARDTALAVGYAQIVEWLASDSVVFLDTRSEDEYNGQLVKEGAVYGGHIPGSIHYDWGNAVDMAGDYRLKPISEIQEQLQSIGATPEYHIVAYCHSGVRAAHTTYVLRELLGYPHVSNYDGSWIEWSHLTAEHTDDAGINNHVH